MQGFIEIQCIEAALELREQIALRRVAQLLFRRAGQRKRKQLFIRAGDDIAHGGQRRGRQRHPHAVGRA